jgi:Arc/MetJ-type ribon-helix-helix transcriptional regulator
MIIRHTGELAPCPSAKIAITIERELLTRLDRLVKEQRLPSRSRAVQLALREKLDRLDRSRLARESAKLDPAAEQRLADEGLTEDVEQWPEY